MADNNNTSKMVIDDQATSNGNNQKISITISDQNVPIVVFFAPGQGGKTMVLLSMLRYLDSKGYQIEPMMDFRNDKRYEELCDGLRKKWKSNTPPPPTDPIDYMLVRIKTPNGKPLFQFLEAPGEHFFNGTTRSNANDFDDYLTQIIDLPNKKIWIFFLEYNWETTDPDRKKEYCNQIKAFVRLKNKRSDVVFLLSKIDAKGTGVEYENGGINKKECIKNARQQYEGVMEKFEGNWLQKLLFPIPKVCYSAGYFDEDAKGEKTWKWVDNVHGKYCRELLNYLK